MELCVAQQIIIFYVYQSLSSMRSIDLRVIKYHSDMNDILSDWLLFLANSVIRHRYIITYLYL